jgi:tRNA-splicing ligase RtcB
MVSRQDLIQVEEAIWEIPRTGNMRTSARLIATEKMLELIGDSIKQLRNIAELPGIVGHALAMPDIHYGYGFPIGGVAAFDMEEGIISPGGVGYDINCGVRLLASDLQYDEVKDKIERIADALFRQIPAGVGKGGDVKLSRDEERKVLEQGTAWAIEHGYGSGSDLENIEEEGTIPGADPGTVSDRALARGRDQIGTLGSGNHFVEFGIVEKIYDQQLADALGLSENQVTLIVHSGSRGLGHQVCQDQIKQMKRAMQKYGIHVPDIQLCCAPIKSPEGQRYLGAMRSAVNYAFANRQMLTHRARRAVSEALDIPKGREIFKTVYEVAHNIAKVEEHEVNGERVTLCVHRKGATRAFAPGRPEIPEHYREVGQPVLIPGDMGRYSYVLVGRQGAMDKTFGSTCHGAGRVMSRKEATRRAAGRKIDQELRKKGIIVRASSRKGLVEEMSEAYKDVSDVVEAVVAAGLSAKVARLRPLAVIKG